MTDVETAGLGNATESAVGSLLCCKYWAKRPKKFDSLFSFPSGGNALRLFLIIPICNFAPRYASLSLLSLFMNADPSAPTAHTSHRSSWFFKLLLGASALFIAGCSAYFSVRGLGLLFIGSATAVMVMAASLEMGKLVAASFLYRYWSQITIPLRIYLTLAVVALIAITSLGNYGYLARAYEVTHTQLAGIEQRILPLQQDIDATQIQIDASRNQIGKFTDTGREDREKIQAQIAEANQALDQSLSRLEDRRKAAKDRQDHDSQTFSSRLPEAAELLKKDLASEDAAVAKLNERVAVLDRAVDAYTAQGGPSILLFKSDAIKKGQVLREQQELERKAIADEIIVHQNKQDRLRADYAKNTDAMNRDLTGVQTQYRQDLAALDSEEQSLRKNCADTIAKVEKQISSLQTQTTTVSRQGQDQIAALYQRIETDNQEIAHLRQQMAGVDIGPYRFIARTFNTGADDVVKWLVLLLVSVFDPLAVVLTVGLNVALMHDRRASAFVRTGATLPPARSRTARIVIWVILLLIVAAFAFAAKRFGPALLKQWQNHTEQRATAGLIPADSFAVLALRPDRMSDPTGNFVWNRTVSSLLGKSALSQLADLFGDSLDAGSDVYVFVKYPARQNSAQAQSPVMLCGLIARLKDPAAAETGLNRFADAFADSLRHGAPAGQPRHNSMVRYGSGRYLDPQGNFLSFAITGQHAILLLEIDGDPAKPAVEDEIRHILAPVTTDVVASGGATVLPKRALDTDAAVSLWFDSSRCFADMPKNIAAQNRYQQLAGRINFDLLLTLNPTTEGQLDLAADYNYAGERFKPQPSLQDIFGKLGPVEPSGVPGRLMDRCAVTLDMEALMDRLPAMLSDSANAAAQIHVEKTIASTRSGRFELVAQYDSKAGLPFQAALRNLVR